VDLHERFDPSGVRLREESAQRDVVERGRDEEHGVRPRRAGLPHLVGVDDEVLAERGERPRGCPSGSEIIQRPTEVVLFGQDR
jgi:hypothetical protein